MDPRLVEVGEEVAFLAEEVFLAEASPEELAGHEVAGAERATARLRESASQAGFCYELYLQKEQAVIPLGFKSFRRAGT